MRHLITLCFGLYLLSTSATSSAQVALQGELVATQTCPALKSIRQADNPQNITLTLGTAYVVLAKNRADQATHYLLSIPTATPQQRWVELNCGTLKTSQNPTAAPSRSQPAAPTVTTATPPVANKRYVLAISWQAAFCETASQKPECRSQTASRFDAQHFTLHGLWPDRVDYCAVSDATRKMDKQGDWHNLPTPDISAPLKRQLDQVMPGTQSFLERHEWIKHGTCYGTAEQYYRDSISLMTAINQSAVQNLFAQAIGQTLTSSQIRSAFDSTFGKGAGERVKITCKQDGSRRLITELTLGLQGDLANTPMSMALMNSKPVDAGCPSGIVDPVGLQ